MKSLPKIKKIDPDTKALLKQFFFGFLALAITAGILTAIWYGTRAEAVTLVGVEVVGGQTISHDEVRAYALSELDGQYAGFVPRRFAWLYPQDDIESAVSQVKRIHSIDVSRIDSRTVLVSFEEFLPDSLWCESLVSSECVFLDELGFAYASSPSLHGGSFLRFVHNSKAPAVGESLVLGGDYQLLGRLTSLLSEQGWFVSHVEVDAARDAFLHVVDGGEFKVTLTQSPDETADNLFVVLTSPEFSDLEPGNFQYIDLRFGNKVFINEEPPALEMVATSTPETETETATSSDAAGE